MVMEHMDPSMSFSVCRIEVSEVWRVPRAYEEKSEASP